MKGRMMNRTTISSSVCVLSTQKCTQRQTYTTYYKHPKKHDFHIISDVQS